MQSPIHFLCSKQALLSDDKRIILQNTSAEIASTFDVFETFDEIEQLQLCDGTGIDTKRYLTSAYIISCNVL